VEKLVDHRSSTVITPPRAVPDAHLQGLLDGCQHVALVRGYVAGTDPVLVRVHSECSRRRLRSRLLRLPAQLQLSLERIAAEDRGVVVYLRGEEGRRTGQNEGLHTLDADLETASPPIPGSTGSAPRSWPISGEAMCLLTNNPAKYSGLAGFVWTSPTVPLITGHVVECPQVR